MKKRCVIVGCGNIGSRHLQALAKLPYEITVDIVEPCKDARAIAKMRLSEVKPSNTRFNFMWHENVTELKNNSDLVIVATTSKGRVDVINNLLEMGHSRFLIEKTVCQSVQEYELLLSKLKKNNSKGWVNTARRYFEFYQKIKKNFGESSPLNLSVVTGNNGLGSNAIHFIDLFSWFCNDYKIRLSGDFLYDKIFRNKRGEEFMEFAGTLIGSAGNGSFLSLAFLPDENLPYTVSIASNEKHMIVDETKGDVFYLLGKKNDDPSNFKLAYISETTTKIAKDIMETDMCLLPTVSELSVAHYELFRVFNHHIKKLTNEAVTLCPIA